ncbi:SAM-dependent methlyltransferase [Apostichopus japonicus]|uniref:SAM-dependent methlyltransferase n=1 Tax=Stichopus japonicus TaxID=307972 RepID=A0A2G8JTX5_STIJA|nr:SAM-dependent methlyltransferase [Apostichopus japonicus]
MASNNGNIDVKGDGINIQLTQKLEKTLQLLEAVDCDDAKKELREALTLVSSVNNYAVSKSTPLSSLLRDVVEETTTLDFQKLHSEGKMKGPIPGYNKMNMISSTCQVQLLQFFIRKLKSRNILEIGSYMGYGTFGMAEAMAPGGKVTGIDIEPYFCDFVNKTARQRKLNIEVKQGSALPVLESLAKEGNKYDFIYVDCQKSEYCDYFKIIMDNGMLVPDGMIAADNALWSGHSIARSNHSGRCLDDFNTLVAQDARVTSALLPCYDGLLLIQHRVS